VQAEAQATVADDGISMPPGFADLRLEKSEFLVERERRANVGRLNREFQEATEHSQGS
jgi:hypothetical protein